ncbi:NAD(P)H-hydrate dehydratase [Candidatus Gottesmanbacteria bacterium]|nr:NAD(P)H-hydrate dehydratase [Candidatus Gottesmanbacteria bacterium]
MKNVTIEDIRKLTVPKKGSHKGQNGRLLLIGGSKLFHAASLWSLTVASRIVDLVHYASVPENNEIVLQAKSEFRNGIVISREQIEEYIEEDDCILIGPGMTRDIETEELTNRLLKKYPKKQWVIDAGALQMMDTALIPPGAILTPHHGEFEILCQKSLHSGRNIFEHSSVSSSTIGAEVARPNSGVFQSLTSVRAPSVENSNLSDLPAPHGDLSSLTSLSDEDKVKMFAKDHSCIVLLKGEKDIACEGGSCTGKVCVPTECRVITGGNEGMTKGGTGDVLAGLIAALACTNDPFLATIAGSFINKAAGDSLYKSVGPYFNATDLADQIPKTMKELSNG